MLSCYEVGHPAPDSYIPRGQISRIGPIEVYERAPDRTTKGILRRGIFLLLPGGFGLAKHNFILADAFAQEGWRVIIPDYFEGDPLPIEMLHRNPEIPISEHRPDADKEKLLALDMPVWLQRHNPARVSSLLNDLLAHLPRAPEAQPEAEYKAQEPLHPQPSNQIPESTPIVGVGYCFGGKHVLRLAKASAIRAAAAFHPSFVEADDVTDIKVPVYIGLAEKDDMMPASLADDLRTWFSMSGASLQQHGESPDVSSPSFTLEIYPGMAHGTAARPNTKDTDISKQYARALRAAIQYLK